MRIDQVDHWIDGLANPSESSPGWAKVETLNIRGSSKTQECWGHNQVKPGALHKCALDKCCPYFSALNLAQVPPVCLLTPMFLPFPVRYIPYSLPLFTPFPHFFYCLQQQWPYLLLYYHPCSCHLEKNRRVSAVLKKEGGSSVETTIVSTLLHFFCTSTMLLPLADASPYRNVPQRHSRWKCHASTQGSGSNNR